MIRGLARKSVGHAGRNWLLWGACLAGGALAGQPAEEPTMPSKTRVVFLGDSITQGWGEQALAQRSPGKGGYVVGNFSISAHVDESHGLDAQIQINPPQLGQFLEEFAQGTLWVETGSAGQPARRVALRAIEVHREYPEYRATLEGDGGLKARVRIFAPLGLKSSTGFLPGLIIEAAFTSDTLWSGRVGYTLSPYVGGRHPKGFEYLDSPQLSKGTAFLELVGAGREVKRLDKGAVELNISKTLQLPPGAEQKSTFVLGYFDPRARYAKDYASATQLAEALASTVEPLVQQLEEFERALPSTGDADLDSYIRWYASAGILLTKGLRSGEVLTMGYRELNPRDSFWATGLHLVFWPELDARMIEELIQYQLPSGRVTATILPVIDRGDEIDSTEYFVLRVARHHRWWRNKPLLEKAWPAVQKAIAYLASRDTEKVGVPLQGSFWADWKDVKGVEGRKYAPHFALLWVAALKAAAELAVAAGDAQKATDYAQQSVVAEEFINRSFDNGGMWNGANYVDRWSDGRKPGYVLEDQVMGAYFDVIAADRLTSLYGRLKANETRFGVRETFPYAPYSSGFHTSDVDGGNYHNGGIWPYLNFVDAAGRYSHGYAVDAERIIHEVGAADLVAEDDYQPHEFLNGDDGRNLGFPLISWDAALFSTIYFGAYGIERVSDSEIDIRVRIPRERDFSTRLILPGANGTLSSRTGILAWQADERQPLAAGAVKTRILVKVIDERERARQ
jgi:familyl 116 glycosyl hydrolase-like protein